MIITIFGTIWLCVLTAAVFGALGYVFSQMYVKLMTPEVKK